MAKRQPVPIDKKLEKLLKQTLAIILNGQKYGAVQQAKAVELLDKALTILQKSH